VTAFGGSLLSGTVSFLDSSNGNFLLGTAELDPATLSHSFTSPAGSPFNVGVGAYFAASADLNGDGIPDLAIVDTANASILLGKGDGTFQNPVTYSTGLVPQAVAFGDFNSDDIQDLVIANYGSATVSVLLGNGDGTFQSQVTYPVGNNPESVEVADVNWDGIQDLVVANSNDNDVSVLLGNGDGTFQTQVTYPTGREPQKIAIGDFNGDGFPDIATANSQDGDVTVLLNNGDGTFATAQAFATGAGTRSVETGDFNGDGIADLVAGNYNGNTISILLGNGDGTFQSQVSYPTGLSPLQMALGDFNGDNLLDVAIANANGNTVSLLLGKGDGTFQPQVAYPVGSSPLAVATADFNGDGIPDLAAPNFTDGGIGTVSILLGQQSETATATNVNAPGPGTHNVLASYPGDSSRAASQSNLISLSGGPAIATTTSLIASVNPVSLGQTVTFTATVNPIPSGATNGMLSFYDGSTLMGSSAVNASGVATYATSNLSAGANAITAVYSGNVIFAGSTSAVLTETVTKTVLTATTTSISASPNPASLGQQVTFIATVSPEPTGTPAGTVNFYNSTILLAAIEVNAGVARFATNSLPVGANAITATYSGNANFATSTFSVWTETITNQVSTPTATTTVLTASPNPAPVGQRIALVATVSPAPTGAAGTVNFYDGTALLGTSGMNSTGVATLTTSKLPVGANHLTAVYSGNTEFAASNSPALTETVSSSPTFTVTAPQTVTLDANTPTNVTITVTPVGGAYNEAVTMSYSGLPAGYAASWSSAAVTPQGKATTTVLTISSVAQAANNPAQRRSKLPLQTAGLALGMCFILGKRKRLGHSLQILVVGLCLGSGLMLTGCAGGLGTTSQQQPQSQSYDVTITGTSAGLHSSTTVTLVVQ
jgi:hypothetical protein